MREPPQTSAIDARWVQHQLTANLNRVLNPAVCYQVLESLKQEQGDFHRIAALMQGDPFIAAKTVGLASLQRRAGDPPIQSIERAVAVLGTRHVQTLVLAVMLTGPLLAVDGDVARRRDLWRWVFGCAAAGDYLGRMIGGQSSRAAGEQHLVTGLLLGLGPLLLQAGLGRAYGKILETPLRPLRLAQREAQALGVTHHQVTLWALESMRCPVEMSVMPQALQDAADDTAWLRARAIEMLGARAVGLEPGRAEAWLADALPRLGLPGEGLVDEALPVLRSRIRELTRVFDVDLGDWQQQQTSRQQVLTLAGNALESLLTEAVHLGGSPRGVNVSAPADPESRPLETDPITGLLTARGWLRQFAGHVPQAPATLGLVLLDLDGFDRFNQRFGRQEADRALTVVGTLMRSTRPEALMLARFHADEFVGLYTVPDEAQLQALVRELQALLAQPAAAVADTNLTACIGGLLVRSDAMRRDWPGTYARLQQALSKAAGRGAAGTFVDNGR